MPELRGSLVRVTASPSTAVGVLVRAPEVRVGRGGVVLTEETQVPVDRGEFTVTLEPGAAVMTVQHAGYPGEVIPLLVTEGQTNIAEAMMAASIADGAEKSEIERLLAAVTEQAHAVAEDASKAAGAVQAVTAQLNAAKDELSAGIAAASFITGIVAVDRGRSGVNKIALGSATQCTREIDTGYVLTKSITAFAAALGPGGAIFESQQYQKNGKLETFFDQPTLYLIIGQPQD